MDKYSKHINEIDNDITPVSNFQSQNYENGLRRTKEKSKIFQKYTQFSTIDNKMSLLPSGELDRLHNFGFESYLRKRKKKSKKMFKSIDLMN